MTALPMLPSIIRVKSLMRRVKVYYIPHITCRNIRSCPDWGRSLGKLVIKNAIVYTMSRLGVISRGVIVVSDGKIAEVGVEGKVEIPADAEVVDAGGRIVTPGLIDAHTHLGVHEEGLGWEGNDTNEITDPVTPHMRAIDGIKADDEGFEDARNHGVTCVGIVPGSANPIGGLGVAVKTYGRVVDEMVVRNPIGLKMAFGENPRRVHGLEAKRSPYTRMGVAALIREWLVKARNYSRKKELFKDQPEKMPEEDIKLEALELVVKGEIPARMHSHRDDDIATALRIAREFNINVVIDHATEAWKIPDMIAEHGVPAVVGPLLTAKRKVELRDRTTEAPKILVEHGVMVAITTDHPVIPIKLLPISAAVAIRDGMPWEEALKALTVNPAKILGIDDRVGSLEAGKDADVVIWEGKPLTLEAKPYKVFIGGKEVYSVE